MKADLEGLRVSVMSENERAVRLCMRDHRCASGFREDGSQKLPFLEGRAGSSNCIPRRKGNIHYIPGRRLYGRYLSAANCFPSWYSLNNGYPL